jgi:hypothetical protein
VKKVNVIPPKNHNSLGTDFEDTKVSQIKDQVKTPNNRLDQEE